MAAGRGTTTCCRSRFARSQRSTRSSGGASGDEVVVVQCRAPRPRILRTTSTRSTTVKGGQGAQAPRITDEWVADATEFETVEQLTAR